MASVLLPFLAYLEKLLKLLKIHLESECLFVFDLVHDVFLESYILLESMVAWSNDLSLRESCLQEYDHNDGGTL